MKNNKKMQKRYMKILNSILYSELAPLTRDEHAPNFRDTGRI